MSINSEKAARPRRGAVAVMVRDQRLLVIRRSQAVRAPGAFCFPGGGIEAGETEEQAVRRELVEELTLDVTPLRRVWHSVTPWQVELAWWEASIATDAMPIPNPDEVESVHWLTVQEMLELPTLLESNHDFLAAWTRGDFHLPGLER